MWASHSHTQKQNVTWFFKQSQFYKKNLKRQWNMGSWWFIWIIDFILSPCSHHVTPLLVFFVTLISKSTFLCPVKVLIVLIFYMHHLLNWKKASQRKILKQQKYQNWIISSDTTTILRVLRLISVLGVAGCSFDARCNWKYIIASHSPYLISTLYMGQSTENGPSKICGSQPYNFYDIITNLLWQMKNFV